MYALLLSLAVLAQGVVSTGTGTVAGRLLSPTGNPAANVRIALSRSTDAVELIGITQTDSAGRYRIENVPPGRYYVAAGLVNALTYSPPVSITVGTVLAAPDFQLNAASGGFRVKGHVIREGLPEGQTPPPLSIRLSWMGPVGSRGGRGSINAPRPPAISFDVAADGSFEIPNAPAGQYSVLFMNGANEPQPQIALDRDVENLQFTIPSSSWLISVEGTVKIDGIAPIPFAGITLTQTDRAVARPDRNYEFHADIFTMPVVPAGEYSIKLTDLPTGYSVKSITSGGVNVLNQPLKVTPFSPSKLEITLSVATPLPGVRVVGRITNLDQVRMPLSIRISGVTPGLKLQAGVSPDGSFAFPLAPPGTYNVEFSAGSPPGARTITVGRDNPTNVEVPLRIANLPKITVIVPNRPGTIFPYLMPQGRSGPNVRATIATDGSVQFLNVQPGSYQIALGDEANADRVLRIDPGSVVSVVVSDKDLTVNIDAR